MRRLYLLLVLLAASVPLCAQRVSVAFYNVENLYDTIPSIFYDDSDYTPAGQHKWGTERYHNKLSNIAWVFDEMEADIVGLAEAESETALRDLVMSLRTDYNYIHRTSGDSRGMDVALLYKGDKFFPESIRLEPSGIRREFLHVTGELLGERVELVVCHMASNLNDYRTRMQCFAALRRLLERLLEDDPAANIIVMGDMNAVPSERAVRKTLGSVSSPYDFMYTPHWGEYESGRGSYNYRGRWYLYDWMLVSPSLARGSGMRADGAGVFVRERMAEPLSSAPSSPLKPLRTFYGRQYLGGYSDHLPIYMYVGK